VTFGVVVLLLVAHQLWWTNLRDHASAQSRVRQLERAWGAGDGARAASPTGDTSDQSTPTRTTTARTAPASSPSRGYAVLRIPRLGVTAPVAEGIGKAKVLNHGYVGHYPRTAQPGQAGNFAVAGHRNTHGEPFRHLDRLRVGDTVSVETATARFTYVVVRTLARTSAQDGTVVAPVPYSSFHRSARMSGRGYYITLTTCTPAFTSRYRLVVWGQLTSARVR
jgi:sortase A